MALAINGEKSNASQKADIFMPLHYIERSLHASALARMSLCTSGPCRWRSQGDRETIQASSIVVHVAIESGNFDELNLIQL
jgi:hypothetical protein